MYVSVGLLFALGLRGHLRLLSHSDVCDYLTKGHPATAIAVLLGCAASHHSTADPFISKTLCLHLPALLPPRHADIDISATVQAAALTGLGLLHCRSNHRLMIEFLLSELFKVPSSDCCEAREAIVLSAGWSLGMVMLGAGRASNDSNILKVVDRLQVLIAGGERPDRQSYFPWNTSAIDNRSNRYVSKCSRIMEREDVMNVNAVAPGAILALTLIYLRSNNEKIADRIALPMLAFELEEIRPDLLFYRALGRCLILWDKVSPTREWMSRQIPVVIKHSLRKYAHSYKAGGQLLFLEINDDSQNMAHQLSSLSTSAALMAYLSILSGLAMGLGLIFAGSDESGTKALLCAMLSQMKS
jgi:anaphase-promoting complex subunit 1